MNAERKDRKRMKQVRIGNECRKEGKEMNEASKDGK